MTAFPHRNNCIVALCAAELVYHMAFYSYRVMVVARAVPVLAVDGD